MVYNISRAKLDVANKKINEVIRNIINLNDLI